jgi:pimeloyl-ACP methyl ester carboxylesterase
MIQENFFFFGVESHPLFGSLYRPRGDNPHGPVPEASGRGIVVCDSLFEEKLWCERAFANLGRYLAGRGYQVLVFDYFGYGNSVGDSIDVDVNSLERDIESACDLLRQAGTNRITLLGVRWSAALACRIAARRDDIDSVAIVNPVKKWKTEFMKALRANVAAQYAIFRKTVMTRDEIVEELNAGGDCVRSGYKMNNIDGYFFSRKFLEQCNEIKLPVEMPDHVRTVRIISIPEKKPVPVDNGEKLALAFHSAGVSCDSVVLEDENAFWLNNEIFTSVTPRLYSELDSWMGTIDAGRKRPAPGSLSQPDISESAVHAGVRESVIEFETRRGDLLDGIIYEPADKPIRDPAFVFSHGGLIGMNGAFRFYTYTARRLAAAGYPCLCFDPHGMGRSHGTIDNKDRLTLFREINHGLLADDVGDAVSVLKKKTGTTRTALFGVCGGAITNLIAQSRYHDVDASFQLSTPVMLPSLQGGIKRMSPGFARFYLKLYLRKIFDPRGLWRFITFRSDYRKMLRTINAAMSGLFDKKPRTPKRPGGLAAGSQQPVEEGLIFNQDFLNSYRNIVARGGKLVFFYGENDSFKWEFQHDFADNFPGDLEAGKELVTVEEIKQANHMYTLREWQNEICDYCLNWADRFAGPGPA